MYDIYLTRGLPALLDLSDFAQQVPEVATSAFQQRLLAAQASIIAGPGFLGLNLSREKASALLARLEAGRAAGQILPIAYCEPQISQQQAAALAEQAIAQIKEQQIPTLTVLPITFFRSQPATWTFASGVKEWREQGMTPGALIVDIDKVDGHVWSQEDYQAIAH